MARESIPTLGDHWLLSETNSLPSISTKVQHGTRREMAGAFYDRAGRLTGRGWTVVVQRTMPSGYPNESRRRMLIRLRPPIGFDHCGEPVIEIRPCGGPSWCDRCRSVMVIRSRIDALNVEHDAAVEYYRVQIEGISATTRAAETNDDPDRAKCNNMQLHRGVCGSCGLTLRRHLPRYAREAAEAFGPDPALPGVSTSIRRGP